MPDVIISNVLNYPKTTAKISDFRGKILILDFWATWCNPCVRMIPRMDSLEHQFGGKIKFLSVTDQEATQVAPFLAKLEAVRKTRSELTMVTSDKKLSHLFPHATLPHYVWIDEQGKYYAATEAKFLTAENIAAFLKNHCFQHLEKQDEVVVNRNQAPSTGEADQQQAGPIYQTIFTAYQKGLSSGYHITAASDSLPRKATVTNMNILNFFTMAYGEGTKHFGTNRIIMEAKDPGELISHEKGADYVNWLRTGHGYCYELQVPAVQAQQLYQFIQADLTRLFPQYSAHVETRLIRCLALQRTGEQDLLRTKASPTDHGKFRIDAFGCELENVPLSRFVLTLDKSFLQLAPYPLIDDSHYIGNTDLTLNCNMSDVTELNQELARYGLTLKEKMMRTEVLVIRDQQAQNSKTSNP